MLSGLLATHGDWDHLLGRLRSRSAALGVRGDDRGAADRPSPATPQRELRDFDDEHYVERPRRSSLGQVQALPVPGQLEVGEHELELHPAEGHVADGMAIWAPLGAACSSPATTSRRSRSRWSARGGSRSAYLATLERLRPLVEQADHVVPGHGGALDGVARAAILREDVAYLEGLPTRSCRSPAAAPSRSASTPRTSSACD